MSSLVIIARPSIIPGFHLAGIEAVPVANVAEARVALERRLLQGTGGLLAIDEEFLAAFDPAFRRRLDDSPLLFLPLPTGEPLPPETSSRARIAALIRQAIGFHMTFQGNKNSPATK